MRLTISPMNWQPWSSCGTACGADTSSIPARWCVHRSTRITYQAVQGGSSNPARDRGLDLLDDGRLVGAVHPEPRACGPAFLAGACARGHGHLLSPPLTGCGVFVVCHLASCRRRPALRVAQEARPSVAANREPRHACSAAETSNSERPFVAGWLGRGRQGTPSTTILAGGRPPLQGMSLHR
jgi:hypothetical protein